MEKQWTLWQFQDFLVTQILREIYFEKFCISKTGAFAISDDLNFC